MSMIPSQICTYLPMSTMLEGSTTWKYVFGHFKFADNKIKRRKKINLLYLELLMAGGLGIYLIKINYRVSSFFSP